MTMSLFLFSTKTWMFLSEIPPVSLFVLCIIYNKHSSLAGGLIPLMILMAALSVFFFIFLFRAVKLTPYEIRHIGRFTPRDRVSLEKDMTLTLTLKKHGHIKIEVYGDSGSAPVYPWLKNSPTHEIRLFNAKIVGRSGKAKKILSFLGAPPSTYSALLGNEEVEFETMTLALSASSTDDGRRINIRFLETL